MNIAPERFVPERLTHARAVRGVTILELSDRTGISRQALSNYENGHHQPTPENLARLVGSLRLPPSYFFRRVPAHFTDRPPLFRTRKSVGQRDREKVETYLLWLAEISDSALRYLDFPEMAIPRPLLDSMPEDPRRLTGAQIVEAARTLRGIWGLGRAPIQHLVRLLESKGVVVSVLPLELEKVDGLSMWSDLSGRPYIVLNEDPGSAVRLRLTLAHELGHLVLHNRVRRGAGEESLTKQLDDQAYLFGSEFLLPEDAFVADVRSVSLESFLALKRKWKVAISAMIFRLKGLDLISDATYRRLYSQLSQRRWRTREPYDDEWELERPVLLHQAFQTLVDEHILSKDVLEDFVQVDRRTFTHIANVPTSFLESESATNVITVDFRR